jgi:hypothetical protein
LNSRSGGVLPSDIFTNSRCLWPVLSCCASHDQVDLSAAFPDVASEPSQDHHVMMQRQSSPPLS